MDGSFCPISQLSTSHDISLFLHGETDSHNVYRPAEYPSPSPWPPAPYGTAFLPKKGSVSPAQNFQGSPEPYSGPQASHSGSLPPWGPPLHHHPHTGPAGAGGLDWSLSWVASRQQMKSHWGLSLQTLLSRGPVPRLTYPEPGPGLGRIGPGKMADPLLPRVAPLPHAL